MTIRKYLGSKPRSVAKFRDLNEGIKAPDAVFVTVVQPGNPPTKTTYSESDIELVEETPGIYHIDVDLDTPGDWYVRWFSTGNGQAAKDDDVNVRNSNAV